MQQGGSSVTEKAKQAAEALKEEVKQAAESGKETLKSTAGTAKDAVEKGKEKVGEASKPMRIAISAPSTPEHKVGPILWPCITAGVTEGLQGPSAQRCDVMLSWQSGR